MILQTLFFSSGKIYLQTPLHLTNFIIVQTQYNIYSVDRVGSSFIVDLIVFGLFQGWLVDDDLRRRGVNIDDMPSDSNIALLRGAAKYVPFFGLAAYLTLRPALPSREQI